MKPELAVPRLPVVDERLMEPALVAARAAAAAGEVPVGAALYAATGELVATASNRTLTDCDPSAHAEVVCLRAAAARLGTHRLEKCLLFVTLEPCAMCAGAIMHARLAQLCFGALDPKTGACGSLVNLLADRRLNHHTTVRGGVCAAECGELLRVFFQVRR